MEKIRSLAEWKARHPGSYKVAWQLGIQREIAEKLGWKIKRGFWNFSTILEEAKKYNSLKSWSAGHLGSLTAARKLDMHKVIADTLGWEYQKQAHGFWNKETLQREAEKYSSIKEWQNNKQSGYGSALRLGIVKEIAENLGWKNNRKEWTKESATEEAKKYTSLVDWLKNSPSSYRFAYKKGYHLDIAKSAGFSLKTNWDYDTCFAEAKKFNSLREWELGSGASYQFALKKLKKQREIAKKLGWKIKGVD